MTKDELEKMLWSIALPGFPQLLDGKFAKGVLFIGLEILINVQSNFNTAIMLSFQGKMEQATQQTNYQWLMFYPCLYFFAMWDAYREALGEKRPFIFLPFAFCAYFVTVGLMYSSTFRIKNVLLGPIWLPILCVPLGICSGLILMKVFERLIKNG
ncbi:hypothetical protein ACFPES_20390 [Paenibacillus sp. GCM10023248]|uniref:hypothetical protein n=1 Tax=Bacillales TaxID=1385 RepID=UPI002378241D|nr:MULTISPECIES: hypothetical protein [Bacillales]MDD9269413.1 hypothetical protein [Paenibacillus sp. MAHUQ-63]MDR6880966.1 hypothetical protein [Bacillus sp. 3255]